MRVAKAYIPRMLHEFLTVNRVELIGRCRQKVATRFEPSEVPSPSAHGVPLLLQQITDLLGRAQQAPGQNGAGPESSSATTEIGRAATLHGTELLKQGYIVDQVVSEYGDLCQAITELAVEKKAAISAAEFRTLNGCLDNAIADAVTSFGSARQIRVDQQAETLHVRLNTFAIEHRRLVALAGQCFDANQSGSCEVNGATATLLRHALNELKLLAERTLPEIHLLSEATTVTSR